MNELKIYTAEQILEMEAEHLLEMEQWFWLSQES